MSLDVYLYTRQCDHCGRGETQEYSANITHNLGDVADAVGIYLALWRPDECGIDYAWQLVEPIRRGIAALESDPDKFRALEPANGWGTCAQFLDWLRRYLAACERFPDSRVEVCR